jgi:hypothetical protein
MRSWASFVSFGLRLSRRWFALHIWKDVRVLLSVCNIGDCTSSLCLNHLAHSDVYREDVTTPVTLTLGLTFGNFRVMDTLMISW